MASCSQASKLGVAPVASSYHKVAARLKSRSRRASRANSWRAVWSTGVGNPAAKQPRDAVQFQRGVRRYVDVFRCGEHPKHAPCQRRQPAQVHAIVAEDAGQGLGRAAPQVLKIEFGDARGVDIVGARPAQRVAAEHGTLELGQAHRAELHAPDLP